MHNGNYVDTSSKPVNTPIKIVAYKDPVTSGNVTGRINDNFFQAYLTSLFIFI